MQKSARIGRTSRVKSMTGGVSARAALLAIANTQTIKPAKRMLLSFVGQVFNLPSQQGRLKTCPTDHTNSRPA
ncbi:MAG: hypothetical protein IAG10_11780 [Planctomycetaceae bacterium]|nr:hypothetical protein [Planctomycetaceae bacterium]